MNEESNNSILLPILQKIPLFATLDQQLHQEIINQIVLMYYPANYTIFNEGEAGDALYIIKKGMVEIFHPPKEAGDLPEKVANLGEHGFFGEMALISDIPRNASAKAETDIEVFILSKENFKKLIDTNPNLAEKVSAAVVQRTNENNQV